MSLNSVFNRIFTKKYLKYVIHCNETSPDYINLLWSIQQKLGPDTTQFMCYQDPMKPEYVNRASFRKTDESESVNPYIKNFYLTNGPFTQSNWYLFPAFFDYSNTVQKTVRVVLIKELFTNEVFEKFFTDLRSMKRNIETDYYSMTRVSLDK